MKSNHNSHLYKEYEQATRKDKTSQLSWLPICNSNLILFLQLHAGHRKKKVKKGEDQKGQTADNVQVNTGNEKVQHINIQN